VSVATIDAGHEISRHVLKHYLDQPYTREAVISGLGEEAEAFIASLGDDELDDKTQYLLNNLGKRTQDESNRAQLSTKGQALFDLGEQIFHGKAACAACHGSAGSGQAGVAPTLWASQWVTDPERLIKVLLHGLTGPITVGNQEWKTPGVMPGFAPRKDNSDRELIGAATYIRNRWGNAEDTGGALEETTVTEIRKATDGRSTPYTAEDFQSPKEKPEL